MLCAALRALRFMQADSCIVAACACIEDEGMPAQLQLCEHAHHQGAGRGCLRGMAALAHCSGLQRLLLRNVMDRRPAPVLAAPPHLRLSALRELSIADNGLRMADCTQALEAARHAPLASVDLSLNDLRACELGWRRFAGAMRPFFAI